MAALWQHAMRTFFALPLQVKLGAKRSADNPRGYYNDEYTKQKLDQKEGFDFGAPVLPDDAEPSRCAPSSPLQSLLCIVPTLKYNTSLSATIAVKHLKIWRADRVHGITAVSENVTDRAQDVRRGQPVARMRCSHAGNTGHILY